MAHNARFDLGFLAQALGEHRSGAITQPVIDTLRMARRAIPGMFNYRLEHLAVSLRLAEAEDHRALSDARLVMGLFRRVLECHRGIATRQQLFLLAPPQHVDEPASSPREAFDAQRDLAWAIAERRSLIMVYEGGSKGLADRRVTPRKLVRSYGTTCLVAYCHADRVEKTFRLDRIRDLRRDPRSVS
jgi:DNA polymerase III epsilon subunit-like protein